MLLVKKQDNFFLKFPELDGLKGLAHAFVCRHGGFSKAPYDSMNLSIGVGDDTDVVAANRHRLLKRTGGGIHVYTRQNHGTSIRVVSRSAVKPGEPIIMEPAPADALITNVPGIRLLIQTADCQAVMLYDPQKDVVANVHCGWRGSAANILGHTVSRMVAEFGCDPGQMIAAIGPSLGPCCAEFINYETEIPRSLWRFRVGPHHFDFWRISRHQLVSAGVKDGSVYASDMCTRCNPHLFFSYRAVPTSGRFAALIGMDQDNPIGN